MQKITEQPGPYRHLEKMDTLQLMTVINGEDQKVALAVAEQLPHIARLVDAAAERMQRGGRLFYLGAGTSGRLGVLDASECPTTYGVPAEWVVGIIAGGDYALRFAAERAEDDVEQGFKDLSEKNVGPDDFVVGIAASGTTPYVVEALHACRKHGIATGSICCNPDAPLSAAADYPVEVLVGPEVVTGSTRMKSGTAQKLVLNMISTGVMIRLGRVLDNRMVDMQITNDKLVDRGARMVAEALDIDYPLAKSLLEKHGSVRQAVESYQNS